MTVVVHANGDVQVNGRWLNIGSEVSVTGERGRFRYLGHSKSSDGKLILNFLGGSNGHELMRSFYPERIKTVHNTKSRRTR